MSVLENDRTENQKIALSTPPPLWRQHDFVLYWSGQCISSVGTSITELALPLLVLSITGSPAQAGLVGALIWVPYFLLGLPIGALIDRWDRKLVLIVSSLGRGVCVASVPFALLLGHLTMVQLYLVSLADGIFYVLFSIAEISSVPHLVPEEQVPTASVLIDGLGKGGLLLGSLCGGILYSLQRMLPFLVDAVSYAICALSLLLTRARFQQDRAAKPGRLHEAVKEGLSWFWQQPLLRFMAVYDSAMVAVLANLIPFTVIILTQRQGVSAVTTGLVLACAGVGIFLGMAVTPLLHRRFSYHQMIAGTGWIWVVLWFIYALAPNLLVIGLISLVNFSLFSPYGAVQMGYRLRMTPDVLQGRVNSIHRLVNRGFMALGLFLAGVLFQWLGPVTAIVLIGGWFALFALAATVNVHVRRA